MSDIPRLGEGHIAEGDLVRYLDDEMTTGERGAIARHLIACTVCAAEIDRFRAARAEAARLIAELPVRIDASRRAASLAAIERAAAARRTGRSRFGGLRAAAVGGVLVASVAVAATPAVREALSGLRNSDAVHADRGAGVEGSRAETRLPIAGATVGFIPSGGESFVVEISNPQLTGALILGVAAGESVTASAVDASEIVDLVVLPGGMRIENQPSATGDYAVSLPRSLREVHIRVAGRPDRVITVSELSSSWISVIELNGDPDHPAGMQ